MSTDGQEIYSYNHRIGYTDESGAKIAQCCHASVTTRGKHVNTTLKVADSVTECVEHGRPDLHKGIRS